MNPLERIIEWYKNDDMKFVKGLRKDEQHSLESYSRGIKKFLEWNETLRLSAMTINMVAGLTEYSRGDITGVQLSLVLIIMSGVTSLRFETFWQRRLDRISEELG